MTARPLEPLIDEADGWGAVEWWRLELRSLDDAPFVQRALAVLGPKDAWSKEYGRPSAGGCLQTLAYVVSLAAPLVAAAGMLRWAFSDRGTMPLDIAGWLIGLSLVITVVSELIFLRRPRAVSRRSLRTVALMHLIPDAAVLILMLIGMGNGSYDAEYDPSVWWAAPVLLDIVVQSLVWVRGRTRAHGPRNPIENLERSVRELSAESAREIRETRDRAIERLRSSGRIDDAAATRALGTELGKLALTMAPEGRSGYFPAAHE